MDESSRTLELISNSQSKEFAKKYESPVLKRVDAH